MKFYQLTEKWHPSSSNASKLSDLEIRFVWWQRRHSSAEPISDQLRPNLLANCSKLQYHATNIREDFYFHHSNEWQLNNTWNVTSIKHRGRFYNFIMKKRVITWEKNLVIGRCGLVGNFLSHCLDVSRIKMLVTINTSNSKVTDKPERRHQQIVSRYTRIRCSV